MGDGTDVGGGRRGWAGTAAAPAAWLVTIGIGWALAPRACGAAPVLHALFVLAAATGVAAVVASVRAARAGRWSEDGSSGTGFVGTLSVLLSAVFLLGILLAWAFVVGIQPCG